jgi:hypothetical protein
MVAIVLVGSLPAHADEAANPRLIDLLAQGKTETDLGHYDLAMRALSTVAEAKEASPAQRVEGLVRLGVARRGAGDFAGALQAFEQASRTPARDSATTALLVQALGGALPGSDRWEKVWPQVAFEADRSDPRRPTLAVVWPGVPAKQVYKGRAVALDFKDSDLQDVFRLFADISGLNVVVNPGVSGRVTMVARDVPWDSVLDRLLAANGFAYQWVDNVLRIARPEHLPPPRPFSGKRIDLDLQNRDLREVFAEIAATGGATVVLDPQISGHVTLKLNQVRWDQAFDVVVGANGIEWSREGDTLKVFPKKKSAAR